MEAKKAKKALVALGLGGSLVAGAVALATSVASCSATPTPVPVRTFERAGRMDVVCVKISEGGVAVDPQPVAQANCAPVADGTDTTLLPYHLFAVVTQTLRGEVAVVDLTAGRVVDVSAPQPGINFIPVGMNPTDIVATADGKRVFVASAEVNKPAIYAIPGERVIGDATGERAPSTTLTEWPVCALPQAPGRMAIIPAAPASSGDGGAPEGGADGGSPSKGARLAVLLPGDAATTSKLVTIDMDPFLDPTLPNAIGPGSLAPCPISFAVELSSNVPASWSAGTTWGNGLPYVDGGVDLFAPSPGLGTPQLPLWTIGASLDAGAPADGGSGDAGGDAGGVDAATFPVKKVPGAIAHGRGMAFDGRFLYVGDDALPLVHVVDTLGSKLTELDPYLATSLANPGRVVTTTEVAVSPATHDFKRYLYALDDRDGTIAVYDATDPLTASRSPMTRPNAELVPAQPPDRIRFALPVTAFSFVRHDLPLSNFPGQTPGALKTGLQCNPNRGVDHGDVARSQGPFSRDQAGTQFDDVTLGAYYRANISQTIGLGPTRLRGLFAFATLSNGLVVVIDVDDWDAACRRPESTNPAFQNSSLQIPQVDDTAFDPYHWADTGSLGTVGSDVNVDTNEAFFPVSPPNRTRSYYFLKDDTLTGKHIPYVLGSLAQLLENGAPVDPKLRGFPVLVKPTVKYNSQTTSVSADASVRLAFEDPTVHVDQDWTVTYEGALPGFDGVAGVLSSTDYTSLSLSNTSGLFCRRGVEDQQVGRARVAAMVAEDPSKEGLAAIPPRLDERLADYVQITDDLLAPEDSYWSLNGPDGKPPACWDVPLVNDATRNLKTEPPSVRYQVCADKFGLASSASAQRDFPVLEAYDDHLVLGRYLYTDPATRPINGRIIAPRDTQSQIDFKLAQCCFHDQAHFRVRTGSQWVAIGTAAGYLHHISADATSHACVRSTARREVLLNARIVERIADKGSVDRNSAFAVRNPMWSGALRAVPPGAGRFSNSTRDLAWKFGIRGQFVAQSVNLASATTSVVPQSMSFIDSIGRLAVVDGSSQGLVLISLDSVAVAGSPYF